MPYKARRPCRYLGCPKITDSPSGYCAEHERVQTRHYDKFFRQAHNARYGANWRKIRAKFLSSNPLCAQCRLQGKYTIATEVHHIKPLAEGGDNDEKNLMALCKSCHSRITLTTENLNWGRGGQNR